MKKTLVILILLIILSSIVFLSIFFNEKIIGESILEFEQKTETGFVTKVIDGDTVVINGESVRLLGIDTNERGEPCYKEAKERMEEFVLNKEVKLERDIKDKDQYKRLLRYIFVEDNINGKEINVNLKMVEEGFAVARFYEDKKYREEILEAEKAARENKRGCKWKSLG